LRSSRRRGSRREPRVLWVAMDHTSPHPYLIEAVRRTGTAVRDLHWAEPENGKRPLGRLVVFVRFGPEQESPMTVTLISPRLLVELVRAREDVVVVYELGLVGLYAGLSKLLRPHKVVSLVEADYRYGSRSHTIGVKVALRRFAARFVDVFVTNSPSARDYVMGTLDVPEEKIVVGWWLAGLPAELESRAPKAGPLPDGVPLFVCASQLIPRKGVDLLIKAIAAYRQRFGPCALWVIGDGPEQDSLVQLTQRLGVEDSVTFLGTVDHATLKGALEACHAFVFPTLQDLVGRVVVEALTAGAPVITSPMTGAVVTIVQDGVNGIVVDPRDDSELAEALHRATDPQTARALQEGVQRMNSALRPDAAAGVLLRAFALARNGPGGDRDAELRPVDPHAAGQTSG
jgi:glycosyltransferase involved in cell wall biosynthesis